MWRQLEPGRVEHRFEPVVLGATLALIPVFIIEAEARSNRRRKDLPSTWDGIWWAAVTVTTVGYGDEVPKSVDGPTVPDRVVFCEGAVSFGLAPSLALLLQLSCSM